MDIRVEKESRYIPQNEPEWLAAGGFQTGFSSIDGRRIRFALSEGEPGKSLVVMPGGIPSDPERQKNLPLINKLFGLMALNLEERGHSGLMYNQPATGKSGGLWGKETLATRTKTLADMAMRFQDRTSADDVSLIGSSSGAYMALRSIEELERHGTHVRKLILLSPAAYPESAERIPYGGRFTRELKKEWPVSGSPAFRDLERYVRTGGSARVVFFEHDEPDIPERIQAEYRAVVARLKAEGYDIDLAIIPGLAHNFRHPTPQTKKRNIVDNGAVRETAGVFSEFMSS